ncbi:GNAT family N-acetyltransferase [Caldibacillus lycopersici]|uniref:GNAT family N-acetyltransferase n=1 Tax=Perspicuibacillus lycopersici TaxID=1325689 RepID=A0AAE3IW01_9BACI|nr:GNAT family protein [Perspicuibacillus lycopersici]MCU9614628.1 GNAT family N-acetyltransferase [Perspicuibacillus lycopersici]
MNLETIFTDFPEMESTNLLLKKIELSNLDDVYSIFRNERVFTYCGIIPKKNIETVSKMIGHFERDYSKKTRIKWGIFLKAQSNKLIGIIEAMDFNQKVNMVTIGYFLAEDYWGHGIATESVQILVKFLFEKVQVNRIQAEVMPANVNSKKVLLKNGFIKEGLLRQASIWSGKGVIDLEIYGQLKADYEKLNEQ